MKFLKLSTLILFSVVLSFLACDDDDDCIKGEGNIETRTVELASIDKVSLFGVDHLTIKQGDIQEVKVTGYPNIIDELITNVSNQEWQIRLENGCYKNADLDIEITIPDLKSTSLIGSGSIDVEDFVNQEDQIFQISGSGNIELAGNTGTQELFIGITGSGNMVGTKEFVDIESVVLNISGSGDLDAFPIQAINYNATLTGSGSANIYAQDQLTGSITGSGNINYKGSPDVNVSITGSGKVNNAN